MKITLDITSDHIVLIKNLKFQRFDEERYGIDNYMLFFDDDVFKSVAMLLGKQDKVIPGTEESPLGAQYEPETFEYLNNIIGDIIDNLEDYETILHQFCDQGGLKPGKYTCLDNERIWKYVG